MKIELGELNGALDQAEAAWMLQSLTHSMALGMFYRKVLGDEKAAHLWDRVCADTEKCVHRAYPANEARYLIETARTKAVEGVARQVEMEAK